MGMVIAVSLACVALGTQLLLIPVLAVDSYQLFLGAVAVSSIYGGGTAGLVTLLISGLGKLYFFMPSNVLAVDSEIAVRMLLFLAVARGHLLDWRPISRLRKVACSGSDEHRRRADCDRQEGPDTIH